MASPDPDKAAPAPTASGADETPKPLLASDALRDELAPVEPWRRAARAGCAIAAVLFGAGALLPGLGPGDAAPGSSLPAATAGASPLWWTYAVPAALAAGAAVIPLRYTTRATVMVVAALAAGLSAVSGLGPGALAAAAVGEWGLLHLLAATFVPAALLFRERYRAYVATRSILGAALLLGVPFAIYCVLQIASGSVPRQAAAGVALGALCTSLVGFMGSEATVWGGYLASLVILGVCGELGTAALLRADLSATWPLVALSLSLVAFAATCALGAAGAFQLLAVRHWRQARQVDLRGDRSGRGGSSALGDTWSSR